jgi:glycosyltransferase involved in cell wall biosynthesis
MSDGCLTWRIRGNVCDGQSIVRERVRKKVLLSAYSCEPGLSSEPGVGWSWALQIAKHHDVWVLTRLANKAAIERELEKVMVPGLHFVYYDLPRWARFWKKGTRGLYPYYILWQLCSLFVARAMHRKIKYDLTHYVTFGSIIMPTFIFFMPTPFLYGPVGGGGNAPLSFLGEFSFRGKVNEVVRHVIQALYRFNPFLWYAVAKADRILVRERNTLQMIPRPFRGKTRIFLETGVPEELRDLRLEARSSSASNVPPLQIIMVGRLLHWKINLLALKAVRLFKEKYRQPFNLFIVGDGAEKKHLTKFCSENGLSDVVHFMGKLSREAVFDMMRSSDIYLTTSFKEAGSWALYEAIMLKVPVICLRTGGPDVIISDEEAVKIDISTPEVAIQGILRGLEMLSDDRIMRENLAARARESLLRNHTWEVIGERIGALYDEIS